MTKEAYFEMCDMLGEQPDPDQIPIEFEDLPDSVQRALELYAYLPDRWEGMSATYMGKDYSILFNLFTIYEITEINEQQLLLKLMGTIDKIRSDIIINKQQSKPSE